MWFAISEPSRRKLIDLLLIKGEASASKLADEVPFSRQAIAKNMVVLKNAGLISERRSGKELKFAVEPKGIYEASKELSQAATLWGERLQKIKEISETIHQEARIK
jgi:DNA-binding transcriptional ArsR family regulator